MLRNLKSLAGILLLLLSACSPDNAGILSLYDQVPAEETAGPWKVVALSMGGTHLPRDESAHKRQRLGSLDLRYRIQPRKGSTIIIRLAYGRRFAEGSSVEARLANSNRTVTKVSAELNSDWVELRLRCSDGSVRFLDIVHSGFGERRIPLKSLIAVEMEPSSDQREFRRVGSLLAWAIDKRQDDAKQVLTHRKPHLTRDEHMRDAVTLVGGDTLRLAFPQDSQSTHLRFWVSGLQLLPESKSNLKVEILRDDQWIELASWPGMEFDTLHWRQIDERIGNGQNDGELRFVFEGAGREVLAIATPILLPTSGNISPKKNLIVVDLDTMRADRLGCYGYSERPTSARLDSALQKRGFHVFRRTHSPGSWTLPATAKFLTSRYLNVELGGEQPSECSTLAEVLRTNGYYCAAFTGGGVLRLEGFERGFHRYSWCEMKSGRLGLGKVLGKVEDIFPRTLQWLRDTDLRPFFLFVHTYETHAPYTRDTFCKGLPHGRLGDLTRGEQLLEGGAFDARAAVKLTPEESLYVQAAYDGGVKKACDATVDLFHLMDELDLWKNSVVVVLSDHGEEFWEHSRIFADHQEASLYGEVLRVPFLIYDPDLRKEGIRFWDDDVTTVDLLPTVADLLQVPLADSCDGVSLKALVRGQTLERRIPVMALTYPTTCPKTDWPSRPCIIANAAKYIPLLKEYNGECANALAYSAEEQLYLLDYDLGETDNRASRMPGLKQQLSKRLREGLAAATQSPGGDESGMSTGDLPNDLRKQLEALGYIDHHGK